MTFLGVASDLVNDPITLLKEYKNFLFGKLPLRIYTSRFSPTDESKPIEKWRYHFGFPEEVVKPLSLLLETTVAWGEKHWKEHEGFWIWWLTVTGRLGADVPWKKLQRDLDFRINSFNRVLRFYQRNSK